MPIIAFLKSGIKPAKQNYDGYNILNDFFMGKFSQALERVF